MKAWKKRNEETWSIRDPSWQFQNSFWSLKFLPWPTIEVRPKSKIHPASDLLQENSGIYLLVTHKFSQIKLSSTCHEHSLVRDWKNAVSSFFIQCLQLHQFAEFRWNVATQKIVGENSVMTKQLRSRQKKVRLWSYHHGSPFLHNHDLINLQTTTRECGR